LLETPSVTAACTVFVGRTRQHDDVHGDRRRVMARAKLAQKRQPSIGSICTSHNTTSGQNPFVHKPQAFGSIDRFAHLDILERSHHDDDGFADESRLLQEDTYRW
jgi:hypothetical protein